MCSVPNTRCNEHKSCVCKDKYLERDGKCTPGIGAECQEPDAICLQKNSECVKNVNEKRSTKFSLDLTEEKKFCTCKKQFVHTDGECLRKGKKSLHCGSVALY